MPRFNWFHRAVECRTVRRLFHFRKYFKRLCVQPGFILPYSNAPPVTVVSIIHFRFAYRFDVEHMPPVLPSVVFAFFHWARGRIALAFRCIFIISACPVSAYAGKRLRLVSVCKIILVYADFQDQQGARVRHSIARFLQLCST
jgi:hypothetical protein